MQNYTPPVDEDDDAPEFGGLNYSPYQNLSAAESTVKDAAAKHSSDRTFMDAQNKKKIELIVEEPELTDDGGNS